MPHAKRHDFARIDGALCVEDVALEEIAELVGTPVHVYSSTGMERAYRQFERAIATHQNSLGDALIAYAVKANPNLSVIATFAQLGAGADTVSEGEIRRAMAAGVPAGRIIFSGVGKTDAELALAIRAGVRQINIESAAELFRLMVIAEALQTAPAVAIRVNPAVGAGAHRNITTGGPHDKFGVPMEQALDLYAAAHASPNVKPVGLACHIGSQITDLAPLEAGFRALAQATRALRTAGMPVTRLDLGGGLGVPYAGADNPVPSIEAYVAMAARVVDGLDVEVAFEPGRALTATSGLLLASVIQTNERPDGRRFVVLDAGMNDLMRPALYQSRHAIEPVLEHDGPTEPWDVVGPICESTDVFARDVALGPIEEGDLVVLMDTGAYGATMASEYNSRPLVPEVLVREDDWSLIRPRPTYEDLLDRELKAEWLQ